MIVRDSPTKARRTDNFLFIPPERYIDILLAWADRPTFASQLWQERKRERRREGEYGKKIKEHPYVNV